jgi:hypothetical protein
MAVKQIHELTAATEVTGTDRIVVSLSTGDVTRQITLATAAPFLRAILEIAMKTDNNAFTDGTDSVEPVGFIFDEVAGTALTENDVGAARMDAKRAQIATLEDATTRGQRLGVTSNGEAKVLSSTTIVEATAAQMTRPGDTTTYGTADLAANSTTAGSVVALSFANATRVSAGAGQILGARIRKSTVTTANASFRLHLFKEAPTVSTTGDNGVFKDVVVNTNASWIGSVDVTIDQAFTSGSHGAGLPTLGAGLPFKLASGSTVYGLLQTLAAYAPGNAETFDVSLVVMQL